MAQPGLQEAAGAIYEWLSTTQHKAFPDMLNGTQSKYYECYVKRSRVMAAFLFKIQHDQYYRDVVINYDLVSALPKRSTDASPGLKLLIVI